MFGMGGFAKAMSLRNEASRAERKNVTEKQFIKACLDDGKNLEEAERILRTSRIFNSSVMIGGKMLTIVEKKKPKKKPKLKKKAKK